MFRFGATLAAGAALMVAGCAANNKLVGRPNLQIVDGTVLPPPATEGLVAPERPFLIGPLDRVEIDVFGSDDISRSIQVDASGRIALPLVGVISASGKTPEELGELIAERLRGRYVRDPMVTVNLTETLSQMVTVDGEVRAPGQYAVAGSSTLMRTIAKASGTGEFAQTNYVVVFRRVNGQDMAALYDLRAIRQGMYADPMIYPNDIVLVGESRSARFFNNVLSTTAILAAPLVALIQR